MWKAWFTRRKERQTLHQSCYTSMRNAQSGDSVLLVTGIKTCEVNHVGIEGEHYHNANVWGDVRRNLCSQSIKTGAIKQWWNWDSKLWTTGQSKTLPESAKQTHSYYFTCSSSLVVYSVPFLKTCHFTTCSTLRWTSVFMSTSLFTVRYKCVAVCCSVLQCVAVCCSVS